MKGEMLGKMISLAVERHAGQFDKGGRPYILHCLTVMHRLRTDDEELQCIAVGHDLIEDTDTTLDELSNLGFSLRVRQGIQCLTKSKALELRDLDADEIYRRKVISNPDAIKVKMQDLRHNSDIRRLKGVRPKDIERVAKYHQFYLELEQALALTSHNGKTP